MYGFCMCVLCLWWVFAGPCPVALGRLAWMAKIVVVVVVAMFVGTVYTGSRFSAVEILRQSNRIFELQCQKPSVEYLRAMLLLSVGHLHLDALSREHVSRYFSAPLSIKIYSRVRAPVGCETVTTDLMVRL